MQYKGRKLAIIEAKSEDKEPTDGLEQVKLYGQKLRIDYVYSTNGHKIYAFNLATGTGDYIDQFPTPDELYDRVDTGDTIVQQALAEPYFFGDGKKPRYYQEIAISKAVESIAGGEDRALLTLATGTGKTYIAFQIAYKLFQARWTRDGKSRRPRVLFLADRNILVDQAMNTFNPLEKDCIKITGDEIRERGGSVPTNANIFFAIYQAVISGRDSEDVDEIGDNETT